MKVEASSVNDDKGSVRNLEGSVFLEGKKKKD